MKDDLQMERRIRLADLYDIYGPILTKRQRLIYEMHEQDDLSFSEISEELSISRQAVSDRLQRVRDRLDELERSLGVLAKFKNLESRLSSLEKLTTSWKARLPEDFAQKSLEILTGPGLKDEGGTKSGV